MNTNDLPPAAKLAALIEAGRAANPDLKQGRLNFLKGNEACALGFAALACGASRERLSNSTDYGEGGAKAMLSVSGNEANRVFESALGTIWKRGNWLGHVSELNDAGRSLDAIILSLREGELAKVCA